MYVCVYIRAVIHTHIDVDILVFLNVCPSSYLFIILIFLLRPYNFLFKAMFLKITKEKSVFSLFNVYI